MNIRKKNKKLENKRSLSILHIMAFKEISDGIRSQLDNEKLAIKSLKNINWKIIVLTDLSPKSDYELRVPLLFRFTFFRELFQWYLILKNQDNFDFILMRHSLFDIFAIFFSPLIKNRITIHHTKELFELRGLRSGLPFLLTFLIEKYIGNYSLKFCRGIIGVTKEIAQYELSRIKLNKPIFTYPNGVSKNRNKSIKDRRSNNYLRFAFISSKFYPWHGIDILMDSIENDFDAFLSENIEIYLIGNIELHIEEEIKRSKKLNKILRVCGFLEEEKILKKLELCDGGISSLALFRNGLNEASSIKTRQYLSLGIPVIAGCRDTAIDLEFKYYNLVNKNNIPKILKSFKKFKKISRIEISDESLPLISKENSIKNLSTWLLNNLNNIDLNKEFH